MSLERTLRNVALVLATALLIVVSLLWGLAGLSVLWKGRAPRPPEAAGPAGGRLEEARAEEEADPCGTLLQEKVLRETFPSLSLEEAVALAGILHTFRMELASGVSRYPSRAVKLPPLRLREAVESVSFVYGWDRRWLERGFEERWGTLRESPLAARLGRRLSEHPAVLRLEEVPDLPGAA